MSEHARLLQGLYHELATNGLKADPEVYVQSVRENLEELQRIIAQPRASRLQSAMYAEAGYWLYRIMELATSQSIVHTNRGA